MASASSSSSTSGSSGGATHQQQNRIHDPLLPSETDNIKSWQTIYPCYIDSAKTVAEGRRIGKSKCVDEPTAKEIFLICRHLQLKSMLEIDKKYPRDPWVDGRVKVLLKPKSTTSADYDALKNSSNPNQYLSKRQLLEKIALLIPRIDTRVKKAQEEEQRKQQEARALEKKEQQQQKKASSGGSGGGKKGRK